MERICAIVQELSGLNSDVESRQQLGQWYLDFRGASTNICTRFESIERRVELVVVGRIELFWVISWSSAQQFVAHFLEPLRVARRIRGVVANASPPPDAAVRACAGYPLLTPRVE
jgi:hypothetical protein